MSTLRERRRRQTARDLQETTIRLALAKGFDAVTTEMIAAEAGVSPRTFFNYFTNKEAAAVGDPPDFPRPAVDHFVAGRGALSDDLRALMTAHLQRMEMTADVQRAALALAREHPRVQRVLAGVMATLAETLADLLRRRLHGVRPRTVTLLATMTLETAGQALESWREGAQPDIVVALNDAWDRMGEAAVLLAPPAPAEDLPTLG